MTRRTLSRALAGTAAITVAAAGYAYLEHPGELTPAAPPAASTAANRIVRGHAGISPYALQRIRSYLGLTPGRRSAL